MNTVIKALATLSLFSMSVMPFVYPTKAHAVVDVAAMQEAKVSFTFDDGFLSTYTNALPILQSKNFKATIYPNTSSMDKGTQEDGFPALSWEQLQELQNTYGWEVGGHTNTHLELPTLTQQQISDQLTSSNAELAAHGLNVSNFATPFGAYDNVVLTEALKYYESHRGFADRDALNTLPYNKAILMVQDLNDKTTVAQVKAWVDQAIANKQWLILVMHDVQPTKNATYEYVFTNANLQQVVNYVASKGVKVQTVHEALAKNGAMVTSNYNFANGMTGWTTDNATQVTLDTNNNGAYTNPENAVKVTGGANAAHLFSNLISAVPGAPYLLDVFYNALNLTGGELGFFIDEYDANGTWISGQWLGMVTNGTIGYFQKFFDATSTLVSSFRVQTYLTANASGTAYVDNVDLHNLTATGSATPTPTGTPTGTPSATNLIQNPTFDSGMTTGWTTDKAANVTIDTANNGGAPTGQNSVKFTGSATASHLFYGMLPINSSTNYLLQAFVNANGLTGGELGFYMDEYDANGTWISGQWLGMVTNGVTSTFSRIYKATSALVNQVRVQTYLTANATGTAFVDNFSMTDQSATGSATPTPTTPSVTPVPGTNLIANATFDNGIAEGWTTNNAAQVTADAANNGGAPTGQNSVKMTGSATASHLFFGLLPVNPAANYMLQAFVNATNLTGGELGFYMDEYDANGTWISGQWLGMVANNVSSTFSRVYKATSTLVNQVRVQTYLTANSTGSAYVDNYSLTDTSTPTTPTPTIDPSVTPTVTPTVTVTPTPTGTPTGTNLVVNGSFEDVLNSFAANWERDTADFTVDTTSHGNAGNNSLHISANTNYAHAFSGRITVDPTKTYTWSQYVNVLTGLGEFGFYVDEYDAAGTWISGQWKGMLSGAFAGNQTFTYTPSTSAVSSIRLQYYAVPNSTFNLYLDSVSLSN